MDVQSNHFFRFLRSVCPDHLLDRIQSLAEAWRIAYPESVMSHHFFDKRVEEFYTEESKFSNLLQIFSAILIFIACLGLYGLISFVVNRRLGEVAVRKVFGAPPIRIAMLVSNDFIVMVLLAFIIATPVSCYLMQKWLETFVFHVNISWWILLLPLVLILTVTMLTVSGQALRAAYSDPAKILKYE